MKPIIKYKKIIGIIVLGMMMIGLPMLGEKDIFSAYSEYIAAKFPALPKPYMFYRTEHSLNLKQPSSATNIIAPIKVHAWAVIIYLDSNQDKKKLVKLLQQQGFAAFISSDEWHDKQHLLIGPELDRQEAVNLANKIQYLFNWQTEVISYIPE